MKLGQRDPKSCSLIPICTDLAQNRLKPSWGWSPAAASEDEGEEWVENPSFVSVFPRQCLSRPTSRCPVEAAPCPHTLPWGCRAWHPSALSCCHSCPCWGSPQGAGAAWMDPPVPRRAGCLWVGSVPAPSPSCASPTSSAHTPTPLLLCQEPQQRQTLGQWGGTQVAQDPSARTNPTNHQGQGSPEPAGLEPACRGEPGAQERAWEGSLRWGGGSH